MKRTIAILLAAVLLLGMIPMASAEVAVTGIQTAGKTRLTVGETVKWMASVVPANATDKFLWWTAGNPGVATVDQNGNIKALRAGQCNITITAKNGVKKTILVTVTGGNVPATGIQTAGKTKLTVGETVKWTASVLPSDAADKFLWWTAGNPGVATVDQKGAITAKKAGQCNITITAKNGVKKTILVTVSGNYTCTEQEKKEMTAFLESFGWGWREGRDVPYQGTKTAFGFSKVGLMSSAAQYPLAVDYSLYPIQQPQMLYNQRDPLKKFPENSHVKISEAAVEWILQVAFSMTKPEIAAMRALVDAGREPNLYRYNGYYYSSFIGIGGGVEVNVVCVMQEGNHYYVTYDWLEDNTAEYSGLRYAVFTKAASGGRTFWSLLYDGPKMPTSGTQYGSFPTDPFTDSELCSLARDYYASCKGSDSQTRPPFARVDKVSGNEVTIQLYETMPTHMVTWAWYRVNRVTGKGTELTTGKSVDLFSPGLFA